MPLEWQSFTSSDVDTLKYILGEAWISIGRSDWESIAFATLTKTDLDTILSVARQVDSKEKPEKVAVDEVCCTIMSKR